MTKPTVILMICYARSGGTLLNRCLGSLPNVVILSELNPIGAGSGPSNLPSNRTIRDQAKNWYGINLESDSFNESIVELAIKSRKLGKDLILRDWTIVQFQSLPQNNQAPINELLALESIKSKTSVVPFAFIRDSIDVWISRGLLPIEKFYSAYLTYLHELKNKQIKTFKYEDFCSHPEEIMKEICTHTNLEYNISFKEFYKFNKVQGDVQMKDSSRGYKSRNISLLPRKKIPLDKVKKINKSKLMKEANTMFDYPTSYESASWVTIGNKISLRIRRAMDAISGSS